MDFFEDESIGLYLKELMTLKEQDSTKQTINMMEHPLLGKVLVINGEVQHIEKYQTLYHEMLVHLPVAFVREVTSVLILGGGSLFAAHEVLKYPTVKNIVLCDYDYNVLSLMSEYYNHAKKVLQDPRFSYVEDDARNYILNTSQRFDLVINDCFNLANESNISGYSYFKKLSKLCTNTGVCVDIIYRHIFDKQTTLETLSYLQHEGQIALSLVVVPEYPGTLHLETIWGNSPYLTQNMNLPVNAFQTQIVQEKVPNPFEYYSPKHLPFYLYLPPYIKNMFNL